MEMNSKYITRCLHLFTLHLRNNIIKTQRGIMPRINHLISIQVHCSNYINRLNSSLYKLFTVHHSKATVQACKAMFLMLL